MSVSVVQHPVASPTPAAPRWAPLGNYPPRSRSLSWPATRLDRAGVLAVLSAAPFVTALPGSGRKRLAATELLLDWPAGSPGTTWQQRWLASEPGVAGVCWRRVLGRWLADHGHGSRWHQDYFL